MFPLIPPDSQRDSVKLIRRALGSLPTLIMAGIFCLRISQLREVVVGITLRFLEDPEETGRHRQARREKEVFVRIDRLEAGEDFRRDHQDHLEAVVAFHHEEAGEAFQEAFFQDNQGVDAPRPTTQTLSDVCAGHTSTRKLILTSSLPGTESESRR